MPLAGFEDKLLSKLDKLSPDRIRAYLEGMVGRRRFLMAIFDHLDEGLIVTDEALRVVFANRKARGLMGWGPRRKVAGRALERLVPEQHPIHPVLVSLKDHPRPIDAYEYLSETEGDRPARTLSLTTLPMRARGMSESGGTGTGADETEMLIVLLHDVTERTQRQAEQARAQRLASMATLTSGVAHEIKNPLNSLNIHAQLLGRQVARAREGNAPLDPERVARAAEVIQEETDRLGRVVEEFLQAARPRGAQLEAHPLEPLLRDVARVFEPECDDAGIAFSLNVAPDLPPVMFDEALLRQALDNLIRNAVEALAERAATDDAFVPRLDLTAEIGGDAVHLVVADNGPGIADDAVENIMEPYFTTKFSGTGLGLMVVYRIVTEHRGALDVETVPGEGARFTISLPLHLRPVRLLDKPEGKAQEA